MGRGRIEIIIQLWMAHDVGLQANKGFGLQPIKKEVDPSVLKHTWVGSQSFLVSYHGVELNVLGDIVLNPPVPAIFVNVVFLIPYSAALMREEAWSFPSKNASIAK